MAVEKSYARLGFFLVVALVVVLATALLFIQRLRRQAVIEVVTYIPEDVSGLDVSSPVRYRGVSVGRVTEVRVDPRETTIEVDFELFLDRLHTIGANVERIRRIADIGGIAPRLRARVVGNPVTGEAYLLLDVPKNPPPPIALGFKPERPYIASMPSPLATVQDRLPAVLERAEATLQILGEIVSRIPGSLDRSDRFFTNVEGIIQKSELPALSADSRKFFTTTSAQIEQVTAELEGVIGTQGKLVTFVDEARAAIKAADLPATNRSTRDVEDKVTVAADDLRRSLPAIRDSLDQLRQLARQLEEEPESMVFGPRPPVKR